MKISSKWRHFRFSVCDIGLKMGCAMSFTPHWNQNNNTTCMFDFIGGDELFWNILILLHVIAHIAYRPLLVLMPWYPVIPKSLHDKTVVPDHDMSCWDFNEWYVTCSVVSVMAARATWLIVCGSKIDQMKRDAHSSTHSPASPQTIPLTWVWVLMLYIHQIGASPSATTDSIMTLLSYESYCVTQISCRSH